MKSHGDNHLFLAKDTANHWYKVNMDFLHHLVLISKVHFRFHPQYQQNITGRRKKVVYPVSPLRQRYRFTRFLFSNYL